MYTSINANPLNGPLPMTLSTAVNGPTASTPAPTVPGLASDKNGAHTGGVGVAHSVGVEHIDIPAPALGHGYDPNKTLVPPDGKQIVVPGPAGSGTLLWGDTGKPVTPAEFAQMSTMSHDEISVLLPPADHQKFLQAMYAAKGGLSATPALNFGHNPGSNGHLLKVGADGKSVVWSDNGAPLTPEQYAQMPASQHDQISKLTETFDDAQRQRFNTIMAAGQPPASAAAKPVTAQSASPTGAYTVQSGESLSKIAARELGDASRWKEIYALNKDLIKNPNLIKPGQQLKLPADAKSLKAASTPAPSAPQAASQAAPRAGAQAASNIRPVGMSVQSVINQASHPVAAQAAPAKTHKHHKRVKHPVAQPAPTTAAAKPTSTVVAQTIPTPPVAPVVAQLPVVHPPAPTVPNLSLPTQPVPVKQGPTKEQTIEALGIIAGAVGVGYLIGHKH